MGGFGLLAMGVVDSSFLFMPLGNDLLMVAMTARRHELMPYYAAMSSAGSVLGCFLVDLVFRAGGEQMLTRYAPRRRLEYVKRKVKKNAGWALAVACLMPPPFPFTPVVMAASALSCPRKKLLGIVGFFRMLRFTVEGALAIRFGKRILAMADSAAVQYAVIALIFICIGGSIVSAYGWIRRSRQHAP